MHYGLSMHVIVFGFDSTFGDYRTPSHSEDITPKLSLCHSEAYYTQPLQAAICMQLMSQSTV